jgi:sugar phosphate isomerase/epimerase
VCNRQDAGISRQNAKNQPVCAVDFQFSFKHRRKLGCILLLLGALVMAKVWTCKIVVNDDAELPEGADFPPRKAAIDAVAKMGAKVVICFSGWGGQLDKIEEEVAAEASK